MLDINSYSYYNSSSFLHLNFHWVLSVIVLWNVAQKNKIIIKKMQ